MTENKIWHVDVVQNGNRIYSCYVNAHDIKEAESKAKTDFLKNFEKYVYFTVDNNGLRIIE